MAYTAPNIPPSGISFATWQSDGAAGHLEALITKFAATSAPVTAPTVSASGGSTAGGSVAAGGYLCVFTETNGIGETTISPVSAAMSPTAGQIPLVTFPALQSGNTARNLYATAANGASGTWVRYATGITAGTTQMQIVAPSNSYAQAPPTVNNTGLTYVDGNGNTVNKALSLIRSAERYNLEDVYSFLRTIVQDFNSGQPVTFDGAIAKLRHAHTAFSTLATLCSEAGTLLDANAGTLHAAANYGIGNTRNYRSWP